jgi:hypothetical protein
MGRSEVRRVGVGDDRIEATDERGVSLGFVVAAAALGVAGERLSIDALGGQDGEDARFGAVVRAEFADVWWRSRRPGTGGAQAISTALRSA